MPFMGYLPVATDFSLFQNPQGMFPYTNRRLRENGKDPAYDNWGLCGCFDVTSPRRLRPGADAPGGPKKDVVEVKSKTAADPHKKRGKVSVGQTRERRFS